MFVTPVSRHAAQHPELRADDDRLSSWRPADGSPHPAPLSASLAQGLIAALTFVHAGVIGYAINHESQTQAQLIGDSLL